MKHTGPAILAQLAPLVEALRSRETLREKGTGVFHARSPAFLPLHAGPSGLRTRSIVIP